MAKCPLGKKQDVEKKENQNVRGGEGSVDQHGKRTVKPGSATGQRPTLWEPAQGRLIGARSANQNRPESTIRSRKCRALCGVIR